MIRLEGLLVRFGANLVLDAVDLDVPDGAVTVLVGANGSGKTTLFRSVAGAVRPTAGRVLVCGAPQDPFRWTIPVSYVSDRRITWPGRTPRQVLLDFAALMNVERRSIAARVDDAVGRLGLGPCADLPQDRLSTGQAARFAIARMLLRPCRDVLLDEPSAGLDFDAARLVRDEVRRLATEGHAVLVSSHRTDEIVRIADRVHVLRGGRIVASPSPEEVAADPAAFEALVVGDAA